MTTAMLRSAQAGAILTALGLSVGLMTAVAEADPPPGIPREHNCPSPFFGDGLNARYGVSERIIGPPPTPADPVGCRTAYRGERWVRAVPPWVTAAECTPPQVDCGGNGVTPIEYFSAKFVSATYVTDGVEPGITAGPDILVSGNIDANSLSFPGSPFIVPVSPAFPPLSVCDPAGSACHTNAVFVTMSARVCNGLPPGMANDTPGLIAGRRCLEAGKHLYPIAADPDGSADFTVLAAPPSPSAPPSAPPSHSPGG